MKARLLWALFVLLPLAGGRARANPEPMVRIGSKNFTESVLLGEVMTQYLQSRGVAVTHRKNLGGTRVLSHALLADEIDVYPEYTGTINAELLSPPGPRDADTMRRELAAQGITLGPDLGFNNTYALGMNAATAEKLHVETISDLLQHPELRFGFSNEFMERSDGWPGLQRRYKLPQKQVAGIDHDLAYRGLRGGTLDLTDLYSTDAELVDPAVRALRDDAGYFPEYRAVLLYRADLPTRTPAAVRHLNELADRVSEHAMIEMNAQAKLRKSPEPEVARAFLAAHFGTATTHRSTIEGRTARLLRYTREHLYLVGISLLCAVLLALPLGVLAASWPRLGQVVLALVGVVQTIPSLALLVFMIPFLGIGAPPAIVALFLYSLLPIVRNTYTGLHSIPNEVRESAAALGLPRLARLRLVELPMAARAILAGIKTAAVINVGTATLGALIGAGGYGQPILTGVRLDDVGIILEGAVPAAVLALAVQGLFEVLERLVVPRGLRLERAH